MSQQLTLEISDETYAALQQYANAVGLSVSEWLITSLNQQYGMQNNLNLHPGTQHEKAHQDLLRYAGAVSLGYATGIENENIDADLAKAYSNEF